MPLFAERTLLLVLSLVSNGLATLSGLPEMSFPVRVASVTRPPCVTGSREIQIWQADGGSAVFGGEKWPPGCERGTPVLKEAPHGNNSQQRVQTAAGGPRGKELIV